jgi:hypothetical protein
VNNNHQTSECKAGNAEPTRGTLLQKVPALLAKTIENGCTEAEALAALAKAQAMIDAYEISDDELALTKEEKASIRTNTSHDPHFIKRGLLFGVAEFTNTKAWYSTGERSFCGLAADIEFAEWLVEALTRFVQAELVEFLASSVFIDGRERRSAMRSFTIGACTRIAERLTELAKPRATQTSNSLALVVTKQAAIDACVKAAGLRFCTGSGRAPAAHSAAYTAGQAAGERASFGRPVSGTGAALRLGGQR